MAAYAKAFTAAVVAGLTAAAAGLDDGSLSAQEWIGVAIAFLVALGAVWAVPNSPTE